MTGAATWLTCSVSVLLIAATPVLVWVKPMTTSVSPAAVGVPEMTPVVGFSSRPAGSGDAVQVPPGAAFGFDVAESWNVYGENRWASVSTVVVITGAAAWFTLRFRCFGVA